MGWKSKENLFYSRKLKKFVDVKTKLLSWVIKNKKGCWVWQGATEGPITHRYGSTRLNGINFKCHRLSYELWKGSIPKGLHIDHLCKNTRCINPDHLEPVTHKENMARGLNATKTHCKRGHEYTPENTYAGIKTKRTCRICIKLRANKRRDDGCYRTEEYKKQRRSLYRKYKAMGKYRKIRGEK